MSDYRAIDTRDLIEQLHDEFGITDWRDAVAVESAMEEYPDEADEIDRIVALLLEIDNYGGDRPEDGIFLIAEDDFTEYARCFAEDIGAIEDDARWPAYCIDWQRAADELATDYTSVEYDGQTWLYR